MLDFQEITLRQKPLLDAYFSAYGEGSCQHSFATSYCFREKYGDLFAQEDGYLFIRRAGRELPESRCYLFPMGDTGDRSALRSAVEKILDDAARSGKTARFESVTEQAALFLSELFPGRFELQDERDLYEYLYRTGDIEALKGRNFYSKRRYVNAFWRDYSERARTEPIRPAHYEGIRAVHEKWLKISRSEEYAVQLRIEHATVEKALAEFDALNLTGLVIFIDEQIEGYIYGTPLNGDVMDAMVGKVNRSEWKNLYPVLYQSFAKECCRNCSLINWEEDLGAEGLRKMKLSYRPAKMIRKFIVTERHPHE